MTIKKVILIDNYKTWKPGRVLRVDNKLYKELIEKGIAEDCLEDTFKEKQFRYLAQKNGVLPSLKEEKPKAEKPKINRKSRLLNSKIK